MFAAAANRAAVIRRWPGTAPTCRRPQRRSTCASSIAARLPACCSATRAAEDAGRRGRLGGAGRTVSAARGRRRRKVAGVDRDYQGNELVHTQGGMTPLLLAARQGYVETRAGAARRRRRRQPDQGRRSHQPAAARDHQRPFRSREGPARPRRGPEPDGDQRRGAAVCGAQPRVGAARRPAAAAGAPQSDAVVSRSDEGAARQGRRSERATGDAGVVLGRACRASTRSARRRSGAPPTPATSTR